MNVAPQRRRRASRARHLQVRAPTGYSCNNKVPRLQFTRGLVSWVHRHLGLPVASTAPLGRIIDQFTKVCGPFATIRFRPTRPRSFRFVESVWFVRVLGGLPAIESGRLHRAGSAAQRTLAEMAAGATFRHSTRTWGLSEV
jgi:hypothetical protein